tara:strand:+ start:4869 stop:5753 length:885 start_codon:yes stop_codon:yes gene_type:complete
MVTDCIGVLGAASPVGQQVIRLLRERGCSVVGFSREPQKDVAGVIWVNTSDPKGIDNLLGEGVTRISRWICVLHIWLLPQYFNVLRELGACRLVCISSTSRYTKSVSSNIYEERLVAKLIEGENNATQWAEDYGVDWTIIRPTLIYGRGNDRNLSEIVRLIKRWHFFPLFGGGRGLRQPVYVDDVAKACIATLDNDRTINKAYNISGADALTYRQMVEKVFIALGHKPRFVFINLNLFKLALFFLRLIPRYRGWNASMVERMVVDMVFDYSAAKEDFNFCPQQFRLDSQDVEIN